MSKLTFVIDCDRCIGCKGCQVACKLQHGLGLGAGRNKVCTIGPSGVFPKLQMYFLPAVCQQCENAACVNACPTKACVRDTADGVIKVDPALCIACGSCERACPYGSVHVDKTRSAADKCDICASLREKGEKPACVRNCSAAALYFGDIDDPESEVSKLLAETAPEHIFSLRDCGTGPTLRYILRRDEWKDVLPQECIEHSVWKKGGRGL